MTMEDESEARPSEEAPSGAPPASGGGPSSRFVNVYPLDSYKIGQKDERKEKDSSVPARMTRMEQLYESEGLRRSVEGVLLVHQHKHPHVLLLQIGASFYKLPGGRMKPGETEVEGLKRKLVNKLAAPNLEKEELPQWEIGEELGTWWRPNFDSHQYPYLPAHVTRPKECKKLFLVHLPETCTFAIARNHSLVAVPLYELYDNHQRYEQSESSETAVRPPISMTATQPQVDDRLGRISVHQPLPAMPVRRDGMLVREPVSGNFRPYEENPVPFRESWS